ncbi:MAG: hypothetical protein L0H29_02955 [Sinobacteraceae bacterium]|nr:hypothetical protein [Nevskiaceae bacterium]
MLTLEQSGALARAMSRYAAHADDMGGKSLYEIHRDFVRVYGADNLPELVELGMDVAYEAMTIALYVAYRDANSDANEAICLAETISKQADAKARHEAGEQTCKAARA